MPHEHNLLFQADSNQSTALQVVLCDLCYFRGWSNMALLRDRRRVTFKAEIWKLVGIHTRNCKKKRGRVDSKHSKGVVIVDTRRLSN